MFKELGDYFDGGVMVVMLGCYGFYVKWEKVNVILFNGIEFEDVIVEMVIELVNVKVVIKGKCKKFVVKKKVLVKKIIVKKKVE